MSSNHIAIVLDRSGSMSYLRDAAVKAYNDTIATIRREAQAKQIPTYVSLLTFAHDVSHVFRGVPIEQVGIMQDLYTAGNTALMDATKDAIDLIANPWYSPNFRGPLSNNEDSRLVIVISDGEENRSTRIGSGAFTKLVDETNRKDNWSLAFQLPRVYVDQFARTYNVSKDNIQPWDLTQKGTEEASYSTQAAIGNYYVARAAGAKSVKTFFKDVTTNAPSKLPAKLPDLTGIFKEFAVTAEEPIKEFLERKTRRAYVLGSGYYQLMKTEKVQPTKQVVLVDKNTKRVFGGPAARTAIGLDNSYAKVTPGNHQNYEIFIQSASPNRKLPRGTKVLFDTTLIAGVKPTWGVV